MGAIDGYLKDQKATSYPACKPALDVAGCKFQAAEPVTKCFTDGKLVTGAAWPAHPEFCSQFMTVLGGKVDTSKCSKGKVLIIAGDYVEDYEIMCVYQMLLTFGIKVDVVCPNKKKDDLIKTSVHDFEGDQTYSEKPGHNFKLNATFDDVKDKLDDYDGLYIPGGRAPEYLSIDKNVIEIVQDFAKKKKVIAQICHGVLVLAAAGILKGRKSTSYPACSPVVSICSCEYLKADPVTSAFTDKKDGEYTLISGAAWPGHIEFVKQFVTELGVTITI